MAEVLAEKWVPAPTSCSSSSQGTEAKQVWDPGLGLAGRGWELGDPGLGLAGRGWELGLVRPIPAALCFSQAVLLHAEKLFLNLLFGLGSLAAACSGHAACCPRFQSCQHSLGSTCCPSGGHRPHGLVAELHVLASHNCYRGLGYPLRPLGAPTGFWGAWCGGSPGGEVWTSWTPPMLQPSPHPGPHWRQGLRGPGPHGQCYSGSSCSLRGSRPGLCRQRACISHWKGPVRLHPAAASCRPSSHVGRHPAVCWPPGGGDGCGAAGSGQGHDRWPGLGTSLQVASKLRHELRPTGLRMQGMSQGPCGRALDPHLRVTPMDREEPHLSYPDGQGDVAEVGPCGAWCSSCMWWHRSAS